MDCLYVKTAIAITLAKEKVALGKQCLFGPIYLSAQTGKRKLCRMTKTTKS